MTQHLRIMKPTTTKNIQDTVALQYGEMISYHVASECLKRLQNNDLGEQRFSFQLLLAYRDAVSAKNPGATVYIAIHEQTTKSLDSLVS